jgi:threonine dehydrogenase-like Zn-dependent dehydrogenase
LARNWRAYEPAIRSLWFGAGPVGQFAIASAELMSAGRVIAGDRIESRLHTARAQGAEVVNFDEEDPVDIILQLTGGIGVDRLIDAVGVDAARAEQGPAAEKEQQAFDADLKEIAPQAKPDGGNWRPGSGPSQVLLCAVAKVGTVSIIGVPPQTDRTFPHRRGDEPQFHPARGQLQSSRNYAASGRSRAPRFVRSAWRADAT